MFDSFRRPLVWRETRPPHRPKGPVADHENSCLAPDSISYYVLLGDGYGYGCNTETCTLNFADRPTSIQAARFDREAKNATGVYVLDGFGNVYTGGGAGHQQTPAARSGRGTCIFVRIELRRTARSYYLLDKYGLEWRQTLALTIHQRPAKAGPRDFEVDRRREGFLHAGQGRQGLQRQRPT